MKILISAAVMAATVLVFYFLLGNVDIGFAFGLFLQVCSLDFTNFKQRRAPAYYSNVTCIFSSYFLLDVIPTKTVLTMTFLPAITQIKQLCIYVPVFDMWNILAFIGTIAGLVYCLKGSCKNKIIGGAMFVIFGAATWYFTIRLRSVTIFNPKFSSRLTRCLSFR
ncbi:MAG: hypothetical protein IPF54_25550 [Draconibacterium sp.]|nr:hypothetical protein [Draconibacterium sp.]